MSRLVAQQQALLNALFAWPADSAVDELVVLLKGDCRRGLKVYQANGHDMAQRALSAVYPVVRALLGAQSFAALARALWHAHPPHRGDLAQWGQLLSAFVRASDQLQKEPYLPDLASLEWALHRAFGAADQSPDSASFALLMTVDPARLAFDLAPGCTVHDSAWPVVSILGAHRERRPDWGELGALLRAGTAETAVVWRAGLQACVRQGHAGEGVFLTALQAGHALSASLDAAPLLDFSTWLPMAAQSGLLLRVKTLPATS